MINMNEIHSKNYNFRSLSLENHLQTHFLCAVILIWNWFSTHSLWSTNYLRIQCVKLAWNCDTECKISDMSMSWNLHHVVIVCVQLVKVSRFFFSCLFVWVLEPNSMPSIITLNTSKTGNICLSSTSSCWSILCYFNQLLPRSSSMFWVYACDFL